MNAFEALLWTGCAFVVLRLIKTQNPKLWLIFGVIAGIGLNRHSHATESLRVSVRDPAASSLSRAEVELANWLAQGQELAVTNQRRKLDHARLSYTFGESAGSLG